ncbi:MAG TPA: hypothetical protein VGA79_10160, partial [Desulfobaccales bacterium]
DLSFPRALIRVTKPHPFNQSGFKGELGFITSISAPHCRTCNRLRLTAASALRLCLFGEAEIDVKNPFCQGTSEGLLTPVFAEAISRNFGRLTFPPGNFPLYGSSMVSIGG